jgi:hypothetical protein
MTAASCTSAFSSVDRPSRRAAMIPLQRLRNLAAPKLALRDQTGELLGVKRVAARAPE